MVDKYEIINSTSCAKHGRLTYNDPSLIKISSSSMRAISTVPWPTWPNPTTLPTCHHTTLRNLDFKLRWTDLKNNGTDYRHRLTAATSLCDDLGTGWPSHTAFDNRWPCFCRCCTGRLEQPPRRRTGIHIAAAFSTSAEVWTFPTFFGPKTLYVTLFFVTWPCSFATLRHVNLNFVYYYCYYYYVVVLTRKLFIACRAGDLWWVRYLPARQSTSTLSMRDRQISGRDTSN